MNERKSILINFYRKSFANPEEGMSDFEGVLDCLCSALSYHFDCYTLCACFMRISRISVSALVHRERDRELQRFTSCRVVGRDDVDAHFGLLWHNCRGGGLPAIFDMKLFAQRAGVEWRGGLGWDGILW